MAEREARDNPHWEPHWLIHVDTILRIRRCEAYNEYIIQTRDKLTYYCHKELWDQLAAA